MSLSVEVLLDVFDLKVTKVSCGYVITRLDSFHADNVQSNIGSYSLAIEYGTDSAEPKTLGPRILIGYEGMKYEKRVLIEHDGKDYLCTLSPWCITCAKPNRLVASTTVSYSEQQFG